MSSTILHDVKVTHYEIRYLASENVLRDIEVKIPLKCCLAVSAILNSTLNYLRTSKIEDNIWNRYAEVYFRCDPGRYIEFNYDTVIKNRNIYF